ncbi:caveolin-1-like [Pecten maximus]|uniref:caveolin-1-like n=1 Tax=Pecten maximus TaxID=6579 RepID=UPI00145810EC|nr:caveolin-1-like [Pecten maximus]
MAEQAVLVDMVKRDPNEINTDVQANFEDVLAEPDGTHSFDCIWKFSYVCFSGGKDCCYKLLSTLFGLCIALLWGCEFAIITFEMVWCYTPMLKAYTISMGLQQKFFSVCINCCLAPVCQTCGLFFSNINVKNG